VSKQSVTANITGLKRPKVVEGSLGVRKRAAGAIFPSWERWCRRVDQWGKVECGIVFDGTGGGKRESSGPCE